MRKTTNIKKEFKKGFDHGFKKGYEKGHDFVTKKLEKYEFNEEKFVNKNSVLRNILGLWITYSIGKRSLKGHFEFVYSKQGKKALFLSCALLESIVILSSIEKK